MGLEGIKGDDDRRDFRARLVRAWAYTNEASSSRPLLHPAGFRTDVARGAKRRRGDSVGYRSHGGRARDAGIPAETDSGSVDAEGMGGQGRAGCVRFAV